MNKNTAETQTDQPATGSDLRGGHASLSEEAKAWARDLTPTSVKAAMQIACFIQWMM